MVDPPSVGPSAAPASPATAPSSPTNVPQMPPPAPVHPDWLVRSRLAQSPFGDCVLCAEREGVLEPAVLETFLADESVRSALL